MNTLQRSSVSFRRQGSSGRIWHDPLQPHEASKSGGLKAAIASEKSHQDNFKHERIANPQLPISVHHLDPAPSPKSESKVQKCSLSSIFRRCLGFPA
ncbi:unnamed protein product [Camellia sinensis]